MGRQLLSDAELMTLLAVLRVGPKAYGVPVAHEIAATAGREIAVAVVYSTLERLEEKGFVTSTVGEPTPERGGRAKRFYRVTQTGIQAVKDTQKALVPLWRGLPQLKEGSS